MNSLGLTFSALLALVFMTMPAQAVITYTNNTVISNTVTSDVIVGTASRTAIVTVTNGGVINGNISVQYGELRIAGGSINPSSSALLDNFDTVKMSGGTIGASCQVNNNGYFTLTGGTLAMTLVNYFQVNLLGGSVSRLTMADGSLAANISSPVLGQLEVNSPNSGKTAILPGGSISTLFQSGSETRIYGGIQSGTPVTLLAGTNYLYGTNFTMVQTATNFTNPSGTFNVFSVSGTLHDGTRMKNVSYYLSTTGNPRLLFVNTNILSLRIQLTPTSPGSAQLKWPSPPYNFTPQFSTNIAATNAWTDLPGGMTQSGTNAVAIVNLTNAGRFFRAIAR